MVRDDDIRSSCFAALDVLCATYGEEVPYRDGLDRGFAFRGRRVPFLSPQKGIFRAAAQSGPAALSINTSARSPYADAAVPDGILYAYRAGAVDQPDNRALRSAFQLAVPLVYFVATRPGWYRAHYPFFIVEDDAPAGQVLASPGRWVGPIDEREPAIIGDPIERRYAARAIHVRVHQAQFRGRVLPAYRNRCAICRLHEERLLDAAHIIGDLEERGDAVVNNGISLCSIHHRAFDQNLVGISPDYHVRVAARLLDDEDGPMLDLLKAFHERPLELPARQAWLPDRERLALRFDRFVAAD